MHLWALELTDNVIAGINPFDLSENSESGEVTDWRGDKIKLNEEIYKCPLGHNIGLARLSEAYVYFNSQISNYDLFISKQTFGVRRGLLRPEPLYLCSPNFRNMVLEENLKGFEFEIAHIG